MNLAAGHADLAKAALDARHHGLQLGIAEGGQGGEFGGTRGGGRGGNNGGNDFGGFDSGEEPF